MIAESLSSIPLSILISGVLMLSTRHEQTFLNLCAFGRNATSHLQCIVTYTTKGVLPHLWVISETSGHPCQHLSFFSLIDQPRHVWCARFASLDIQRHYDSVGFIEKSFMKIHSLISSNRFILVIMALLGKMGMMWQNVRDRIQVLIVPTNNVKFPILHVFGIFNAKHHASNRLSLTLTQR